MRQNTKCKPELAARAAGLLFFGCVVALIDQARAAAESGAEILAKVDAIEFAAQDLSATVAMTLVDRSGRKTMRKMRSYQKGSDKRLIRFLEPADVKGMAFLDAGNDKLYVYLSAFRKTRRIAGHFKKQPFAGTDFSYEDLASKKFSNRYAVTKMTSEGGHYILRLVPKVKKKSAYAGVVMHVRKTDYLYDRLELFDQQGKKWKVMTRGDFRKVGPYVFAFAVEMADLQKGHKTVSVIETMNCDTGLTDRFFSPFRLDR